MEILVALLRTVRPRQWLKNLALFAALMFSGLLFETNMLETTVAAALAFCLVSSGVYIMNDLVDVKADRLHPYKKKRPIASGKLPKWIAILAMVLFLGIGLTWMRYLSYFFYLIGVTYLLIQVAYTGFLKKIPIMDVLLIASGYLLRVYGGAVVINAHMDVWFLLTVISLSLFLAVGKRKGEQTLLKGTGLSKSIRGTLKRYTEDLLNIYTSMFATATWLTYALFAFNHPRVVPKGRVLTLMSILPKTLMLEKMMMVTIPLVVYGVMRYLQLIYEKDEGESPERVLLTDSPLLITVGLWVLLTIGILYYVA